MAGALQLAQAHQALVRILGPTRVSQAPSDRICYARDLWPRGLLGLAEGDIAPLSPDLVVWPESTAEVAEVVRAAYELRVPLVPFGGGSGVCGGTLPLCGGIMLDMKRMNRLTAFDAAEGSARFQAGIIGEHLEHELARLGFTLGHFPSSIYISTLGGWLATRSAGQMSTRYGKIEDMVRSLTVVTGSGEVLFAEAAPRVARGPDWAQIFVGSEGTLGVITEATLRVQPAPRLRILRGFEFPRVAAGCEAIRRILQRGLRPAVVRLYDEVDTLIARASHGHGHRRPGTVGVREGDPAAGGLQSLLAIAKRQAIDFGLEQPRLLRVLTDLLLPKVKRTGCLLLLGCEGQPRMTEAEAALSFYEATRAGGRDLGSEPGDHWYATRYKISYKQSQVFWDGAFVDTMEVATTWDRLLELYAAVRKAISQHALVLAHFSHAYAEGCSIYFTFVGGGGSRAQMEQRYDAIWRDGLSAAIQAGSTLSHHHGVGLSKASFMEAQHHQGMSLYRNLKQLFDPAHILNPGKMGLA